LMATAMTRTDSRGQNSNGRKTRFQARKCRQDRKVASADAAPAEQPEKKFEVDPLDQRRFLQSVELRER